MLQDLIIDKVMAAPGVKNIDNHRQLHHMVLLKQAGIIKIAPDKNDNRSPACMFVVLYQIF